MTLWSYCSPIIIPKQGTQVFGPHDPTSTFAWLIVLPPRYPWLPVLPRQLGTWGESAMAQYALEEALAWQCKSSPAVPLLIQKRSLWLYWDEFKWFVLSFKLGAFWAYITTSLPVPEGYIIRHFIFFFSFRLSFYFSLIFSSVALSPFLSSLTHRSSLLSILHSGP
jgi:hypothetical protein